MESLLPSAVLDALVKTAQGTPPGAWVEIGVYAGGSAVRLYAARGERTLHLFDTFSGLPVSDPSKGDRHAVGEFDGRATLPALRVAMPEARFHVGRFPCTLPDELQSLAFVHVDVDQYACVGDCIKHLQLRMVPGGVMWFDDMELAGARRAVLEHFSPDCLQHAPEGRRFIIFDQ